DLAKDIALELDVFGYRFEDNAAPGNVRVAGGDTKPLDESGGGGFRDFLGNHLVEERAHPLPGFVAACRIVRDPGHPVAGSEKTGRDAAPHQTEPHHRDLNFSEIRGSAAASLRLHNTSHYFSICAGLLHECERHGGPTEAARLDGEVSDSKHHPCAADPLCRFGKTAPDDQTEEQAGGGSSDILYQAPAFPDALEIKRPHGRRIHAHESKKGSKIQHLRCMFIA